MFVVNPSILLLLLLAIPVGAAIAVAFLGPQAGKAIRWISFIAATVALALSIALAVDYRRISAKPESSGALKPTTTSTFQPEFVPGADSVDPHTTTWNLLQVGQRGSAVQFYIGIDGINIWLVVLTTLLMFSAVLISLDSAHVQERTHEYFAWLLTLETGMLGVFVSFDIILFYVFFELTLIPLFFLIGIWGGPQRRYAARKFFIYTLAGSLITLLGLIGIVLACHSRSSNELTFSIPRLVTMVNEGLMIQEDRAFWLNIEFWVFLAMMA